MVIKNIKINKSNFLMITAVLTSIFSGYKFIGTLMLTTSIILFALLIYINRLKLSIFQTIVVISFVGYVLILYLYVKEIYIFQNLRYWFGSLLFFLLFKIISPPNISVYKYIFKFGCYFFILEAFLINTLISSESLHNISSDLGKIFFGFYERPVGFTANPGTTSVFLIVINFLIEIFEGKKSSTNDLLLLIIAVILSISGTGIMILFTYFFFRYIAFAKGGYNQLTIKILLTFIFVFTTLFTILSFGDKISDNQKYSTKYVSEIIQNKYIKLQNDTEFTVLGVQVNEGQAQTSGDFGLQLLYNVNGTLGFIIYVCMLLSFWRADARFLMPLLLLLIGSLHYPSAFSGGGHVLMALIIYGHGQTKTQNINEIT